VLFVDAQDRAALDNLWWAESAGEEKTLRDTARHLESGRCRACYLASRELVSQIVPSVLGGTRNEITEGKEIVTLAQARIEHMRAIEVIAMTQFHWRGRCFFPAPMVWRGGGAKHRFDALRDRRDFDIP
jgi:hypothetical protein